MIEFVAEWTRQASRKVGFLNLRGKRIEVLSESIQVKSSFLLSERFNIFINEIMDFIIRPRFEASPLFFDKGIPIQDTPANYTSTEVYWGEDFDVVLLTHRNIQFHQQKTYTCLLYTSPSPRDLSTSRMPSSA
eukprot:TRINITY_DN11594_c0_g1_i1.p3 TRINITY_DN11594_c0_g1~~TRINITY_DN11594_c0_g1_i1.p3  ORF type:complete len:133 (-),score=16.59 TRINITY_DN11594_c0_g1_i1:153-551(-)